eukprot:gene9159-10108_t
MDNGVEEGKDVDDLVDISTECEVLVPTHLSRKCAVEECEVIVCPPQEGLDVSPLSRDTLFLDQNYRCPLPILQAAWCIPSSLVGDSESKGSDPTQCCASLPIPPIPEKAESKTAAAVEEERIWPLQRLRSYSDFSDDDKDGKGEHKGDMKRSPSSSSKATADSQNQFKALPTSEAKRVTFDSPLYSRYVIESRYAESKY